MPVMIALPLFVNSSFTASQNEEFKRYETFQTPAASRRTISRAARSWSSADNAPNFFGAGRRLGASLLIKPDFLAYQIVACSNTARRDKTATRPRSCKVALAAG